MGGPGLQQDTIHRKVLIAEQRLDLWSYLELLQEHAQGPPAHFASLRKHLLVQQPIAVFDVDEVGRRRYMVGCQIGSSGLRPTNQRFSRL